MHLGKRVLHPLIQRGFGLAGALDHVEGCIAVSDVAQPIDLLCRLFVIGPRARCFRFIDRGGYADRECERDKQEQSEGSHEWFSVA